MIPSISSRLNARIVIVRTLPREPIASAPRGRRLVVGRLAWSYGPTVQ